MNDELILVIISLVISGLSFFVAFLSYWRNRPSVQLKKDQEYQMLILAGQSIVFWKQLESLAIVELSKSEVDPYIFGSLRKNALRFEDSLQKAIGLGLWTNIIGDNPRNIFLFSAFIQSLLNAGTSKKNDITQFTSLHILMGVIRTIEACEQYGSPMISEITEKVYNQIDESLKADAWIYLNKDEGDVPENLKRIMDEFKVKE